MEFSHDLRVAFAESTMLHLSHIGHFLDDESVFTIKPVAHVTEEPELDIGCDTQESAHSIFKLGGLDWSTKVDEILNNKKKN